MKELIKPLFTWFVGLFNFSIYKFNAMNEMDSLILALQRNGVEKQANELLHLYQMVGYQQETLIMLETFKCLFMVLSILFVFILNLPRVCEVIENVYSKCKHWYNSIKTFFKNKSKTV
jgi:hypothetical protein